MTNGAAINVYEGETDACKNLGGCYADITFTPRALIVDENVVKATVSEISLTSTKSINP